MQETRVQSLGSKDPLEKGMATHSSILPGEFHEQRRLADYSLWGRKESGLTERLRQTQRFGRWCSFFMMIQLLCGGLTSLSLSKVPRRLAQPREEMDFGVARAEPRLSGFIF